MDQYDHHHHHLCDTATFHARGCCPQIRLDTRHGCSDFLLTEPVFLLIIMLSCLSLAHTAWIQERSTL